MRKNKYRSNRLITIKCSNCGEESEVFERSLCGVLNLCKECVQKEWGTKDLILRMADSFFFNEEDIEFYKKLFKLSKI